MNRLQWFPYLDQSGSREPSGVSRRRGLPSLRGEPSFILFIFLTGASFPGGFGAEMPEVTAYDASFSVAVPAQRRGAEGGGGWKTPAGCHAQINLIGCWDRPAEPTAEQTQPQRPEVSPVHPKKTQMVFYFTLCVLVDRWSRAAMMK